MREWNLEEFKEWLKTQDLKELDLGEAMKTYDVSGLIPNRDVNVEMVHAEDVVKVHLDIMESEID